MLLNSFNRRDFCSTGLTGLGALMLAGMSNSPYASAASNQDHFFLVLHMEGGWDPSYLFDARALSMTKKGIIQNYIGKEPTPWVGLNDNQCLASTLTEPLKEVKDHFSIINGVLMATSFEGHLQNTNYLFTGNPFGGNSYLPWLAQKGKYENTILTGVSDTGTLIDAKNHGGIIPFSTASGKKLINNIKKMRGVNLEQDLHQFILDSYKIDSQSQGKMSLAKKLLQQSYSGIPSLSQKLSKIEITDSQLGREQSTVNLLKSLFKKKLIRMAMVDLNKTDLGDPTAPVFNVDTHDPASARLQPKLYKNTVSSIKNFIQALWSTAYDEKRSMLDVTTFIISSEFGRTMRQGDLAMDKTGTDHNPLSNSFLIGGKGIKTGQVIGQSDYQSADEKLSKVHLLRDSKKFKTMGRCFNFKTMKSLPNSPEVFDLDNYLSINNITNSLLNSFGVPKENFWQAGRTSPKAQLLSGLFK